MIAAEEEMCPENTMVQRVDVVQENMFNCLKNRVVSVGPAWVLIDILDTAQV